MKQHAVWWVARGLLGAALFAAVFLKPTIVLYPLLMGLGLLVGIAIYVYVVVFTLIHIEGQKLVDDTYRIPGTEIALRTTFKLWTLGTAPYLEVRIGDGPPLKFCLAGPSLTRAQLYSVEGDRILFETSRDTYLVNTKPFSVEGPPRWMAHSVFVNKYGSCDYDARSDAPVSQRIALTSGLKLVYLGAFDADGAYRRFWPASLSPEQKIEDTHSRKRVR